MSEALITLGAAFVGAGAGLGGAFLTVTRQAKSAGEQSRNEAYARFLGAAVHVLITAIEHADDTDPGPWIAAVSTLGVAQGEVKLLSNDAVNAHAERMANWLMANRTWSDEQLATLDVLTDACINEMRKQIGRAPLATIPADPA